MAWRGLLVVGCCAASASYSCSRAVLGDDFIASATLDTNGQLKFSFGDGWESYLQEGNLKTIMEKASSMMNYSRLKGKGKEKGKGKSKASSG